MKKVKFRLQRASSPTLEATALLWHGNELELLLEFCEKTALDPTGRVFCLANALLVKLSSPLVAKPIGAVRLYAIAPNVFLPVDATLTPSLLEDEAAGLSTNRGIVFLPDGRVLAFDPRLPLSCNQILTAIPGPIHIWNSLPIPRHLASRIHEFVVVIDGSAPGAQPEDPQDVADRVLDPKDPSFGPGEFIPNSAGAGAAKTLAGKTAMGLGKGMIGLGSALGIGGLSALGARLIQGAVGMAPKLGDGIFGKQSAALRDLLQRFRDGDVDGALERALPFGNEPIARGSSVGVGADLPRNDLVYRLQNLLGGNKGKSAGYWTAEAEIKDALTREYRRAAAAAMQRGDHRRAAWIFAKLLGDFSAAAKALERGGYHRDAAAFYLAMLGDKRAAALAFEAAGDIDRAAALYRETGNSEAAGDLYRRVGEEELAIAEYHKAAKYHAASGDFLAAGDLLRKKVGREDLAEQLYRNGWVQSNGINRIHCGSRLESLYAKAGRHREFLKVLDEAETIVHNRGDDPLAPQFYHGIAELADLPSMSVVRAEVRDRVKMALGIRLRTIAMYAESRGRLSLSSLLGGSVTWTPAAVSDAEFSIAAAYRKPKTQVIELVANTPRGVRLPGTGPVTAYSMSHESGDLFVGFEGGEVYCYHPTTTQIQRVCDSHDWPIAGLSASPEGRGVVIHQQSQGNRTRLSCCVRDGSGKFEALTGHEILSDDEPILTPIITNDHGELFGFGLDIGLDVFEAWTLCVIGISYDFGDLGVPTCAFLLPNPNGEIAILSLHGSTWWFKRNEAAQPKMVGAIRLPGVRKSRSSPSHPTIFSSPIDTNKLAVAFLDESGAMHWNVFERRGDGELLMTSGTSGARNGYRAVAVVRRGLVVAVSETQIDYYVVRQSGQSTVLKGSRPGPFHKVVACVYSKKTEGLLLIEHEGTIQRVPAINPRSVTSGR